MNNNNKYYEQLHSITDISFSKIVDLAIQNLPFEKKIKPWKFINHGIDLLHTEDDMNCYLAAYGKMHEAKIKEALNSISNPEEIFNKNFTIIDWGCGQGLATVCFFDFLKEKNIGNNAQEVVLIEPSGKALNRAKINVIAYTKNKTKIKTLNKYINDIEKTDIFTSQPITIHFFSNILDITSIDIDKLAKLIKENNQGEHYFVCVGPLNLKSTRIDEFANKLNISEEQIIKKHKGKLKNVRGTIKLLVFKIKGKEINVIKTDFYPPIPNSKNYIYMIENILDGINPLKMDLIDKIIQYYKAVVELERLKEPEIKNFYLYKIDGNDKQFSVDIQQNEEFSNEYIRNADPKLTKWPQDILIGINGALEEENYTFLQLIIPFEDLKDFDINIQTLPVKVSDFEVSIKNFKKLELSDEKIDELENLIKEKETINEIVEVLQENISDVAFEKNVVYLALSSKNPALSQIYSELKRINKTSIKQGSLLEKFLLFKKIDNKANELTKDDLIQVTNLDESQKNAVLNAFNNKLSVITGPPGSGKTQVILNIIANALLQNKKILVASKNNKAVDNVKDRFDLIDETGYFLRFGSKRVLEENTIPAIERIISLHYNLEDNGAKINNLKEKFQYYKKIISENKAKLELKENLLTEEIPHIEKELEKNNNKVIQIKSDNAEIDFFEEITIKQIDAYRSSLKIQKNIIERKYYGISKIWFNWFSKKKYIQELLNTIELYPFELKNYINKQNLKSQLSEFKNGDDIIELLNQLINLFTRAIEYKQTVNQLTAKLEKLKIQLKEKQKIVDELTSQENEIKSKISNSREEIVKLGKSLTIELIKNKIKNAKIASINNYKDYLPDKIPWKSDEVALFKEATKSFLDNCIINSVTSLSAKAAFPLENELFDMIIIDEASQCDIASAIPLLYRAKQMVVIGDPLQLKHISNINDFEEATIKEKLMITNGNFLKYNKKSLWDYSKELLALATTPNNSPIMIDSHYRCHPQIIGYSNEAFYLKFLAKELSIYTKDEQFNIEPKGIIWIDVIGEQKSNNINVNMEEVNKSIELAVTLAKKHKSASIGIITPFRHQAEQLNARIPDNFRNQITADTVHKFQGDEKDIIIYTLVVTKNSPIGKIKWIDNSVPYLVNVAVTRARNTLYIVGNKEYIKNNSPVTKPLGKLVRYVERLNNNVR